MWESIWWYLKELFPVFTVVVAAAVGSGFYALTTAQRYIRNRTFDPQFNQVYFIRFIIGIVAGSIIGIIAIQESIFTEMRLGPQVLAIVGGYSAEVVQQILTRLAEALLTLVKGSPADQRDAAVAQAKADAEKHRARDKAAITTLLLDIEGDLSVADSDNLQQSRDEAVKKLKEAVKSL